LSDARRLAHQARPERSARHAIARATAVEIDLVVAGLFSRARGLGEVGGFAASELQRYGMFLGIKCKEARAIAAKNRRGGDHLRVEQHRGREAAQEVAAVPIGPVHHWSDTDFPTPRKIRFFARNAYFSSVFQSTYSCDISAYGVQFTV